MNRKSRTTALLATLALLLLAANSAQTASLTWNLAVDGDWDYTTNNWTGDATTFSNGDDVTFNNTAGGTIAITANVAPSATAVSAGSGTYIFTGGPIAGGSLNKSGGGTLHLASANAFDSATLGAGTLDVRAAGALGAGEIAFNGGLLAFRTVSQTVDNKIQVGGGVTATSRIEPWITTTFAGGIDIPSGSTLRMGMSNSTLAILAAPTTGTGNLDIFRSTVAMNNVNQIPDGNLFIGSAGGDLILDNVSWADFTAARPNGYGTGAGQWRLGGGIGARGDDLLIQASGLDGGGTDTKTWFNRNLALGAAYSSTGRAYADAKVTIDVDTELTTRRDWQGVNIGGPGMSGTHNNSNVNAFLGDITDQVAAGTGGNHGALRFSGTYGNNEIILAGANNWTGSYYQPGLYGSLDSGSQNSLNTGKGGMMVYCISGQTALVQFDGQASLPTGNAGGDAWLAATSRYSGSVGFILAAKDGGESYQLPAGMRFLMGSSSYTAAAHAIGILGATGPQGSSALLQDTEVCIQAGFETGAQVLDVLVRGPAEFTLGTPGVGNSGAVLFQPTWRWDGDSVDNGIDGAATVVQDSAATRTLRKRGDGTVVLEHVAYTRQGGTGDTSGQFKWALGSGHSGSFDGAVRETGTDVGNSTAAFNVAMYGGVLELGGGNLARNTGTGAGELDMFYGGGFSAFGADRTVTLNGGAGLTWGDTANRFLHGNYALIFGSQTADSTAELTNNLSLNTSGTRTFIVAQGTGDAPEGRLSGVISGGAGFRLTAPVLADGSTRAAGTLELANAANTFTGAVNVEAGKLLVTGLIPFHGSNAVTVSAGATLAGNGIVNRLVAIFDGATLAPGASIGTLTIGGDLTLAAGSTFEVEIDGVTLAGTDYDQLVVTGDSTIQLGGATLALTFGGGFAAQPGNAAFIIDNQGPESILGAFQYAEGEVIGTFNGRPWYITYTADYDTLSLGGGNDVALVAIPEPTSGLLLALAGLTLVRRRRR